MAKPIPVSCRISPSRLLTPALSSLKNGFSLKALTRHFVPPSPVPTGEGFYFAGRLPGAALADSLTPGYYLSPR